LRFLRSSLKPGITRVAFSALVFASFLLSGAMVLPAQEISRPPQAASERRALDPLTGDEQAAAERIARSDAKVKELLGETGVRLVSATPVLIKTESPERFDVASRQIEVVLFRPQGEVGARVVVNLQRNAVVEVSRLASDQVPFTNDDLADAFQLAMRDAEVLKALGPEARTFRPRTGPPGPAGTAAPQNTVGGLPVRSPDPNDPCSTHRCLRLTFRRGTDYLSEPIVVVDLTAKHVSVEKRDPNGRMAH
jgi:hypothetical protein